MVADDKKFDFPEVEFTRGQEQGIGFALYDVEKAKESLGLYDAVRETIRPTVQEFIERKKEHFDSLQQADQVAKSKKFILLRPFHRAVAKPELSHFENEGGGLAAVVFVRLRVGDYAVQLNIRDKSDISESDDGVVKVAYKSLRCSPETLSWKEGMHLVGFHFVKEVSNLSELNNVLDDWFESACECLDIPLDKRGEPKLAEGLKPVEAFK